MHPNKWCSETVTESNSFVVVSWRCGKRWRIDLQTSLIRHIQFQKVFQSLAPKPVDGEDPSSFMFFLYIPPISWSMSKPCKLGYSAHNRTDLTSSLLSQEIVFSIRISHRLHKSLQPIGLDITEETTTLDMTAVQSVTNVRKVHLQDKLWPFRVAKSFEGAASRLFFFTILWCGK